VLHHSRIEIPVQGTVADPPMNRVPADSQLASQGALAHALLQVMPEQHSLLPSDHRASPRSGGAKVNGTPGRGDMPSAGQHQVPPAVRFSTARTVRLTSAAYSCESWSRAGVRGFSFANGSIATSSQPLAARGRARPSPPR